MHEHLGAAAAEGAIHAVLDGCTRRGHGAASAIVSASVVIDVNIEATVKRGRAFQRLLVPKRRNIQLNV
ncbi:MAG: hypothetical protein M9891_09715 [Austwickia sp.]|nr:hypothetical protein [Austwickia sp.]